MTPCIAAGETREYAFGEIVLRLPSRRRKAHRDESPPAFAESMGLLSFPLRQLKGGDAGVRFVGFSYGIARDFGDFLTLVTGSYMTVYDSSGPDRPVREPHSKYAVPQTGHFDSARMGDYATLFDRLMQLSWEHHSSLLSSLRCYRHALRVATISPSMSCVLLVAALEACGARFVEATPTFDDFSEPVRKRVAEWQRQHCISNHAANALRQALVEAEAGKLRAKRRFVDVVLRYLPDSFWERNMLVPEHRHPALHPQTGLIVEVPPGRIEQGDLPQHLAAVYSARSAYVHAASELEEALLLPGYDWVPSYEYDSRRREFADRLQRLPTLRFLADLTQAVLIAILQHDHPSAGDEDIDPEEWFRATQLMSFLGPLRPFSG
jgi:hypothetical protein